MQLSFAVPAACDGWQLRDVLRKLCISAQLSRAVKRGSGFFLDGLPVHTDVRARAGQTLSFLLPNEPPTAVPPEPLPLAIAYEDDHALLLQKPAGMAVHPTRGYESGTLANAWMGVLQARGQQGVFRPVSRLDVNTSGLVLCAQNAYAAPLLAAGAQKQYLAVCEGELPPGPGVIDAPIALCEGSTVRRRALPKGAPGRPSRTEYAILAAGGGLSLAAVRPLTGRTHQIRVHFASLGHPLAGDDLYGGSRTRIARQALHCASVTFSSPAAIPDHRHTVTSPLPPDMAALAGEIPGAGAALAAFYAEKGEEPGLIPAGSGSMPKS